jgi:hypothetical protein
VRAAIAAMMKMIDFAITFIFVACIFFVLPEIRPQIDAIFPDYVAFAFKTW